MSLHAHQRADAQMPARQRSGFLLLWTASTTSSFASWVMKLALPMVAAQMTTSPLLVSGVTFAFTLPWLTFGLQAGALTDRLDRRTILLGTTTARLLTLSLLAIAATFQAASLPFLYGTALVLGTTETLTSTAATALVPVLVPSGRLERANVWLIGAQQVIEVIAPPLSGAVMALGLALAVGLGGAGYGVALIALLSLRGAFRPIRPTKRQVMADILEGLRFLWQQPVLRAIGIMAAVINACWTAWLAVLVLYALAPGPMRLTTFQYGLLLTGSGVGGIIGTALVGPVQRWLGRRWLIGLNILGNGLLFLAPALSANAWLVGAAIIIGGMGGPMWGIEAVSFQQRMVPEALQGRVTASYQCLGLGAEAIGPLVGGFIGQYVGLQAVFLGSALLTFLMFALFFQVVTAQAMASK